MNKAATTKFRVTGDVLKAFSVEIEIDNREPVMNPEQTKRLVAEALRLKRYGRDEDVRIDEVEEIK